MVLLLSLIASVFFAVGYVLQYHEAHEAPAGLFLSPKILFELAKHRIWLGGILAMAVGDGLQALALDRGSLAIIEPALTASLLFALPLSAAWRRERLRPREWLGAISVSVGLAAVIVVGSPTQGSSSMPAQRWLLVTLGSWGLALAMVAMGRRVGDPSTRAALVGGAAGVLFGLQDALTRFCLDGVSHDFMRLVVSWQPYVLLITAFYGLMLVASAYEVGPLPAALPPIAIGEPVVGMLIGVFAFGEHMTSSPIGLAVEAAAAVLMVVGAWSLARSPLVCGAGHPSRSAADGTVITLPSWRRGRQPDAPDRDLAEPEPAAQEPVRQDTSLAG